MTGEAPLYLRRDLDRAHPEVPGGVSEPRCGRPRASSPVTTWRASWPPVRNPATPFPTGHRGRSSPAHDRRPHHEHHPDRRRRLRTIRGRDRLRKPPRRRVERTRRRSVRLPLQRRDQARLPTRRIARRWPTTPSRPHADARPARRDRRGPLRIRITANPSPAHALHDLAEAEHAELIVVGSSHTGRLGRVAAGEHRRAAAARRAVCRRGRAARLPHEPRAADPPDRRRLRRNR